MTIIQCRRLPRGAPRGDGAGAQDVRADGSAGHAVCRSAAARDAGVQGQVWAQQVLRLPAVLVQKYKYTSKASKLSGAGTLFACFTGTKVRILTQLRGGHYEDLVFRRYLSLLALLVQQ
jgi:hypothetical protein